MMKYHFQNKFISSEGKIDCSCKGCENKVREGNTPTIVFNKVEENPPYIVDIYCETCSKEKRKESIARRYSTRVIIIEAEIVKYNGNLHIKNAKNKTEWRMDIL